jgi:hypothetical protein
MGLVEVAYQLRRVSHQLKVFVATFAKFDETTSMAQQYRGSTVDIAYSPASLRDLRQQRSPRDTAESREPARLKSHPLAAFFGTDVVIHDHRCGDVGRRRARRLVQRHAPAPRDDASPDHLEPDDRPVGRSVVIRE